MQVQKFYINTTTRTWYNAEGQTFSSGNPRFIYKKKVRFELQLVTDTPFPDEEEVVPETDWTKDRQYGIEGVMAYLSLDNDYRRRWEGTLEEDLEAGEVSEIVIKISGASYANIRPMGLIRLYGTAGEDDEVLEYQSRTVSNSVVTFKLAEGTTIQRDYYAGAVADVSDMLYAQSSMIAEDSDPATGFFVFELVFDSPKLRAKFEHADLERITDLKGMELLIFSASDDSVDVQDNYILTTCSLYAPMADVGAPTMVALTQLNDVGAMVEALLSYGFLVEFSQDGVNWHEEQESTDEYLRSKLAFTGDSGEWTVIKMLSGPANTLSIGTVETTEPGTDATATITGDSPNQILNLTIPRAYNGYVYVAYASDSEGSDFSTTPSDELKYRAEIHSDKELVPTEEDFAGAKWLKYLGDFDGVVTEGELITGDGRTESPLVVDLTRSELDLEVGNAEHATNVYGSDLTLNGASLNSPAGLVTLTADGLIATEVLPIATSDSLGVIKAGTGLKISEDGTLEIDLTQVALGLGLELDENNAIATKIGAGLEFDSAGAITATETKVGAGLEYDENNAISAKVGSGLSFDEDDAIVADLDAESLEWKDIDGK